MKYSVEIAEIWIHDMCIEADSAEEAELKAEQLYYDAEVPLITARKENLADTFIHVYVPKED